MAYKNVGVPRIYADLTNYLNILGQDVSNENNSGLDCAIMKQIDGNSLTFEWADTLPWSSIGFAENSYISLMNHNFNQDTIINLNLGETDITLLSTENVLNINSSNNGIYANDTGTSILTFDGTDINEDSLELSLSENNLGIGSVSFGFYYDIPHAPDTDLNMTVEFDGYESVTTKSGSTLSNVMYMGAPWWYDLDDNKKEPWAVGSTNGITKKAGRKSWDLKFSYISSKDLFASNYMSNTYMDDPSSSYNDIYATNLDMSSDSTSFEYNLNNDNSFMSILQKITNGSKFIFQPDNQSSNPSDFHICTLDQNSLSVRQTAYQVYEFSLKISECW